MKVNDPKGTKPKPTIEFGAWMAANPPPDLGQLVLAYGGYGAITGEAWAEYDAAMARWQQARRDRFYV